MEATSGTCRCVLCHDDGPLDAGNAVTAEHVQRYGWSNLMIAADEVAPGWAYTIGLWHSHRIPDLAMFGLDVEVMRDTVELIGQRAVAGERLAAGQTLDGVLVEHPVHLKPIDLRWVPAFFPRTMYFYQLPPIEFLQVTWPDLEDRSGWDAGGAGSLPDPQPRLWLDPADHPEGVWTRLLRSAQERAAAVPDRAGKP